MTWFLDILKALERQTSSDNTELLLELNCYLTSKLTDQQALYLHLMNEKLGPDPITGLQSKTNYGRPNLDKLFNKWLKRFEGKTIGVFYCGPKPLASQLKWLCIKKSENGTSFKFHEETF